MINRRRTWAALAMCVLMLVVAACGGDSSADSTAAPTTTGADATEAPTETTTADATAAPADASAFPVTIEHQFGEATIEERPLRIVATDMAETEVLVALGEQPVGIATWFNEMAPWLADLTWETEPELLLWNDGMDVETIISLEPDLIVGGFISEDEYAILSEWAPTLQLSYSLSARDRMLTVGRAIGREADAAAVADQLDAEIEEWAAAHPQLSGLTLAAAWVSADGFMNFSDDVSIELATRIGMVKAPGIAAVDDFAPVSYEELGVFDADVMLVFYESEERQAEVEAMEVFQNLPAVQEGRYFGTADGQDFEDFRATGVLQMPYALDTFFSRIAEDVS